MLKRTLCLYCRSYGESLKRSKIKLTSSIMSQMRCYFLMLVLLTSCATTLGKTTDSATECGEDKSCAILAQLMKDQLSEVNKRLDKQATSLEELKADSIKTLASTVSISTQLGWHSTDLLRHDGRLREHDISQGNEYQLVQKTHSSSTGICGPRDCNDLRERGYHASGIYRVYPGSDYKRIEADVYCDFQSLGQSWLVFQRRIDGSVNFERLWKDYAEGFGNLNGEFWLGNEKLYQLTTNRKYKLRIELEDFMGQKRWAEYSTFSVKPVTDKYRLTAEGYSGNAGDGLAYHTGHGFSTKDVDNDAFPRNCAQEYRGAWWYAYGHQSNLNGFYYRGGPTKSYADGIGWYFWHGHHYSLKTSVMKIMAVY